MKPNTFEEPWREVAGDAGPEPLIDGDGIGWSWAHLARIVYLRMLRDRKGPDHLELIVDSASYGVTEVWRARNDPRLRNDDGQLHLIHCQKQAVKRGWQYHKRQRVKLTQVRGYGKVVWLDDEEKAPEDGWSVTDLFGEAPFRQVEALACLASAFDRMTDAEFTVTVGLIEGLTAAEIADRCGLSVRSVRRAKVSAQVKVSRELYAA